MKNFLDRLAKNEPYRSSVKSVKKYLLGICLIIALIVLSVFWGFHLRTNALFERQMVNSSRAFFEEIVITRQWMADHGGVYVEMRPGDEVNPYLQTIPGLKTVIRDADGKKYMLKNPALATREISEIADRQGSFRFHITSLNPLNPAMRPMNSKDARLNGLPAANRTCPALRRIRRGRRFATWLRWSPSPPV